jgi:hypothetical protein
MADACENGSAPGQKDFEVHWARSPWPEHKAKDLLRRTGYYNLFGQFA